jgi:circadian clock protein KaiB
LTEDSSFWELDLYIAGQTPKSTLTYNKLLEICEEYLAKKCIITIFDLRQNPKLALDNQITAIPTIIRRRPLPKKILIGDLTNTARVLSKLELKH